MFKVCLPFPCLSPGRTHTFYLFTECISKLSEKKNQYDNNMLKNIYVKRSYNFWCDCVRIKQAIPFFVYSFKMHKYR